MTTSGTYGFAPQLADLTLEAFSRIGKRPTQIDVDMMVNARLSANLMLSSWASPGVNLWKVDTTPTLIALVQGTAAYALPANTVTLLDAYVRQYQMAAAINETPNNSTVLGSQIVTVTIPNHGLAPGNFADVVVPISVGGVILLGFYQVVQVTDANNFTITANVAATATVNNDGAMPVFTTTAGSSTVKVTINNHQVVAQQAFSVQVATSVGGITLNGIYTVINVIDANNFNINAGVNAGANAVATENNAKAQFTLQVPNQQPQDRYLVPLSRTDYAQQPNKFSQAPPTNYWFQRLINPQVTLWQVPDGNGPYVFSAYLVRQMQDAVMVNGTTLDIPYRFDDAFAAGLAYRLAVKYAPALAEARKTDFTEAWNIASRDDVENVPISITPGLGGYFR